MSGELLRDILRPLTRLGRALRTVCMPWLLLTARIWLSQVVFVHRIMMMMTAAGGEHVASPALEAIVQGVGPLFLATGLLTRPIALALLVRTVWGPYAGLEAEMTGPKAALLVWLIVVGPGVLSLDHSLGRGLSSIPFGPVRAIHRLYGWTGRALGPLLRLAIRAALAASLVAPVVLAPVLPALSWVQDAMLGGPAADLGLPTWWAAVLAVTLVVGCAMRLVTLILACMVPLLGITMSIDDRFAVLLLLLMLAASGAGILSVDHLLARWACRKPERDAAVDDNFPHVVVVGGGFGGVAAVQGLRRAACRITLIDQRNHHLFQPLLYQVATAALSPAEIATPIRSLFRDQLNVRVHLGEVTGVDPALREVLLGTARMRFDYLVLATGARHSYFGRDDWAPLAPGLKNIEDATSIRSRLLRAFEEAESATDTAERVAWLTFVIVGGGPTGIELAGAIAELARYGMQQEYRSFDPATARVILVQSGPRILPSFPPGLSVSAERSLRALGVDVRLGTPVRGVDERGVDVCDQRIEARTVLWAAGVAASPAAQWLGRAGDASGRLAVGADLSVPHLPGIYAIGDTAACLGWRGAAVPGLAPAAKQQGRYVARAIGAALTRRPAPPPFQYRHFGSLATIGRQAAVAELGALRLWGAPAWWFWGAVHVAYLVGGRNRATVLLDWLWAYLTYRRSTRLITGAGPATQPPR
jgi:NADH:ubiquinone reductase (H+-translocating)